MGQIFWPNKISNQKLYKKTGSQTSTMARTCAEYWAGLITKIALRWTPPGAGTRTRSKKQLKLTDFFFLNLFPWLLPQSREGTMHRVWVHCQSISPISSFSLIQDKYSLDDSSRGVYIRTILRFLSNTLYEVTSVTEVICVYIMLTHKKYSIPS